MPTLPQRLADLANEAMLTPARVTHVDRRAPGFVRVELRAEAFRKARWTPGEKLQFPPQRGSLRYRTYTPTRWDTSRGETELIAFTHGDGPAASWFRHVAPGDTCEVFGQRHSLDLSDPAARLVFVGDESSIALARALDATTAKVWHVFEATDPESLRTALTTLDTATGGVVLPRSPGPAELLRTAREAAEADTTPFDLVVSGDAAIVHAVRRAARDWPRPARRVRARAYWAAGRTGLD